MKNNLLMMRLSCLRALLFVVATCLAAPALVEGQNACDEFGATVKRIYNFKPSALTPVEREAKSAAMDAIWKSVKARPGILTACLRRELQSAQVDQWFRFDGSNLLVEVDPSASAKQLQVDAYSVVDFGDVDPRYWVAVMALRGVEGFDTSKAGERWLTNARDSYFVQEHGTYEIKPAEASLYVFGSMDERFATPALARIAALSQHPRREQALGLLLRQATPEAARVLASFDVQGISAEGQAAVRRSLTSPDLFTPRAKPRTTRATFIFAFEKFIKGDAAPFFRHVSEVPDGEVDAVAVLKPEDIPLVRQVRRRFIASANPTAREFYESFTKILHTLVAKHRLNT